MAILNIDNLRSRSLTIKNETAKYANTANRIGSLFEDTVDTYENLINIVSGQTPTAGGTNTTIQYNDSGNFTGTTAFTWNNTSRQVGIYGDIAISGTSFIGSESNGTAIRIGSGATVNATSSIALGTNANTVNGTCSIAIGVDACTYSVNTIGIGRQVIVNANNAIAIGNRAFASGGTNTNSIAIGTLAYAVNSCAGIAMGCQAKVCNFGANSIAIGTLACSTLGNGTAIGNTARALGSGDVALGSGAVSCSVGSIAIGNSSNASATRSIAIGEQAMSNGFYSISIGKLACNGVQYSIAIGYRACNFGIRSILFGDRSWICGNADNIVIGNNLTQDFGGETIVIGCSSQSNAGCSVIMGANASNSSGSEYAVVIGKCSRITNLSSRNAIAIGRCANSSTSNAISIGNTSNANGNSSIAIGCGAYVNGTSSIGIGTSPTVIGNTSMILGGSGNTVNSNNIVLIGGTGRNITGTTYSGYTVVENLAILETPETTTSGSTYLVWDNSSKKVKQYTGGTGNGWAFYTTSTGTSAQTITTSPTQLVIDGTGSDNNENYVPLSLQGQTDVFWDTSTNVIKGINVGDSYDLRLSLEITSKVSSPTILELQLDIAGTGGTPTNVIVHEDTSVEKTTPFTRIFTFPYFTLDTFIANNGRLFLNTDTGSLDIGERKLLIVKTSDGSIK